MLAILGCTAALAVQGGATELADLPVLRVGEAATGEIVDGDAFVRTAALDMLSPEAPVRADAFRVEIAATGTYHIDLRGHPFDAYLILRDEEGAPLAEDDDALVNTQARLVVELVAGRTYRVEACALLGLGGLFELALTAGPPPERTPHSVALLVRDDAERRLAVAEELFGPDHLITAVELDNAAMIFMDQGEHGTARELLDRSLGIRECQLGPDHRITAGSYNHLATLHRNVGDYQAARPLFERALAIWERELGPEHVNTVTALNNLSLLLENLGEYDEARASYDRLLVLCGKVFGPEHENTAASLNNLALLLDAVGEWEEARSVYERALAIEEKLHGPRDVQVAKTLNNLGLLLKDMGSFEEARTMLERALEIRQELFGADHHMTAQALGNLGLLLFDQGDFEASRRLFERSLELTLAKWGPDHEMTAHDIAHLARVAESQKSYDTARRLYERVLAIYQERLGPEHPHTITGLNNLGGVLVSLRDYAGAQPLYARALAARERVLGPKHPLTGQSLNNLGNAYQWMGDHRAALPLQERALAIWMEVLGPGHPETATYLDNLAILHMNLGEPRRAWDLVRRGRLEREVSRERVLPLLTEVESYRYLAQHFWDLELELSLSSLLEDPAVLVAAYEDVLGWKGQVGRTLAASRSGLDADDTRRSALVAELREVQARLSSLMLTDELDEREDRGEQLRRLREERNRLELDLKRATAASIESPDALSFAELRSALPPRSVVLDFLVHNRYVIEQGEDGEPNGRGFWSSPRLSVWITSADSAAPVHVDLGPADAVQRAVADHLAGIVATRGAPERGVSPGTRPEVGFDRELVARLVDPLRAHLDGVELVFASPDSFLATLPIETLRFASGQLAIERFGTVYLQDLGALARPRRSGAPEFGSLLAVGGVDFHEIDPWKSGVEGASPSSSSLRSGLSDSWESLPATAEEAHRVHALHAEAFGGGGVRLLLQSAAPSEARLKHELPRHSVLHLATHGFFHPEGLYSLWSSAFSRDEAQTLSGRLPGLLSGLVCAGAAADTSHGEDGYLTAEEVGWLDLSRVELVALSACETGLGRSESGEGLLGLRRAFHAAGARTVVSSLWSVQDESTAELMRSFYANLWTRGMGRLDALRAAQLAMLARNRARFGDPLTSTWGAFVLSGEWR